MRTPSLRRRVVLWAVGVLAVLLLVVGVGVDLALGAVLKGEQQQRLVSVAALAPELTGLSDQSIADRLSIAGIRAEVHDSSGGTIVVGTPQAPPQGRRGRPPAPRVAADPSVVVTQEQGRLVATQTLRPGVQLVLTDVSTEIDAALLRFRMIMTIASLAAIALAAILLPVVLRRAMRPLGALTAAARETADGGRGRRLSPRDPSTDLGRAAVQFDAMLEELEGAERRAADAADQLGRFLSDASHELRTPLAGVSAGAERLIREPLDDDERDRVTVAIVREARRAGRLVDDLLLVSRLGALQVQTTPQPIGPVLRDAAGRAAGRRGGPTVAVAGPETQVAIDRERLDQVLANLIGNAGNAGAGRVLLRTRIDGDDLEISVSDDGPGVAEAARELVFERLVRLDPGRSAGTGGAGLGLPIARGLVAAHGGTLAFADPAADDLPGAVLRLRLPLAVPPIEAPAREQEPARQHDQAVGGVRGR
ncbi:sensor histidine kinase [uncultured Amnibacterium sp.]|uniref:sensor histidine kinase n=1 Tax=uncultured Amnibacterium sp. TaxID=1631851 RepID=UPI0035CA453D